MTVGGGNSEVIDCGSSQGRMYKHLIYLLTYLHVSTKTEPKESTFYPNKIDGTF